MDYEEEVKTIVFESFRRSRRMKIRRQLFQLIQTCRVLSFMKKIVFKNTSFHQV